MSKLIVSLALVVLVFGVALHMFQGEAGLTETVRDGHGSIIQTLRSFDYVSD
jgi:hypothetical protein